MPMNNKKELVIVVMPNGCHECTSHCKSRGYTLVTVNQRTYKLHRLVYERKFGPIPTGLCVRHKCDNRGCCNIEHLELGTIADNNRDIVERNRHRPTKGEKRPAAKLKDSDIPKIRELLLSHSQRQVAKMYGVSRCVIGTIYRNQSWKHVL